MGISLDLSSLAFGPIVEGACQVIGATAGERLVSGVVTLLTHHFTQHSVRLLRALDQAHERAWRALEIALAGDSFWQRCKLQLSSGEDKAFREQVRVFLDAIPAEALPVGKEQFRRLCWDELRQARHEGVLALGTPSPEKLAQRAGAFARFHDPQMLLRAEQETLKHLSTALSEFNYKNLALLLMPREGPSLLAVAVRYFLRRAIEDDAQLFQGLAFAQLRQIQAEQEKGFAALGQLLYEQADQLEALLDDVAGTVKETHEAALDVRQELQNQGLQNSDLYEAVLSLQARFDLLRTEVRPRDTLSIRNDAERRLASEVVRCYRLLSDEQRCQLPALLNAIGKLEVAAGAFEDAGRDFAAAAELLPESSARAETHINAYRVALEQSNWRLAQEQLQHALALDSARFAPFPLDRYRLIGILGAGVSGVAFLCEDTMISDASQKRKDINKVVIKTLLHETLDSDIDRLFAEAKVVSKLNHPGVVRFLGHGFTDPGNRSRPYLVMEHFEGRTLEEYIREEGTLSFGEWLAVARQMAEALLTTHRQKILHRDLKPANVLIRSGEGGLRIQLIDFGLALRHDAIRASGRGQSLMGVSIAGTLDYSAPEQLGRLPGVKAGPYSDVFGFGRTSCYALFQTPQPALKHWQSVPQPLADLLGRCVGATPEERFCDFAEVLNHLKKVQLALGLHQVLSRVQAIPVAQLVPDSAAARPVRPAVAAGSAREAKGGGIPYAVAAVDATADVSARRQTDPTSPSRRKRKRQRQESRIYGLTSYAWILLALGVVFLIFAPLSFVFIPCASLLLMMGLVVAIWGFIWVVRDPRIKEVFDSTGGRFAMYYSPAITFILQFGYAIKYRRSIGRPFLVEVIGLFWLIFAAIVMPRSEEPPFPSASPAAQSVKKGPRLVEPPVKDPENRKVYLSDLTEFDVGSFPPLWHFGKDGRRGDSANQKITADGRDFAKALGMHPPDRSYSTVKYRIAPAEILQGLAGFDDESAERLAGDFSFEVLGDGKTLWKSKPIRERGPFQVCRVWVTGVRILELRVYAPKDASNHGGGAVWLDPYITRPTGYREPPPTFEESDDPSLGKKVYLSDLAEIDAGPFPPGWRFGKNGRSGEGQGKIEFRGKEWSKGIGMHPPAEGKACRVRYRLGGRALKLRSAVAINSSRSWDPSSDVLFEIWGDGRLLWKSNPIERHSSDQCSVDLKGVSVLELRTRCTGGITGCHAVWLNPFVRMKR